MTPPLTFAAVLAAFFFLFSSFLFRFDNVDGKEMGYCHLGKLKELSWASNPDNTKFRLDFNDGLAFIEMDCTYRFRLTEPGEQLAVLIRQADAQGELLIATLTGNRVNLDDRAIARAFIRHPLMTVKVMVAIHWEALWLWVKGARLVPRPAPAGAANLAGTAMPPPAPPAQ